MSETIKLTATATLSCPVI